MPITGVSVGATVSFTLPQCIAVAKHSGARAATARTGGERYLDNGTGHILIMVGQLDDWLKVVMEKGLAVDPGATWVSPAWPVFKKAYRLFRGATCRVRSRRLSRAIYLRQVHISADAVISSGDFLTTIIADCLTD